MTDILPYIMPAVGVLTFVLGIWWRVEGKIDAVRDKAEKAEHDLAEHKLHVAEVYVSKQGLREQTGQLMEAISGVRAAVDHLNTRVDRIFETKTQRTTRPS